MQVWDRNVPGVSVFSLRMTGTVAGAGLVFSTTDHWCSYGSMSSLKKTQISLFSFVHNEPHSLSGVSNLWPTGRIQPRMDVNAAQHKIVDLLKTLWDLFLWLCITMYLMCAPRQLFFQCGTEMPKVSIPLEPDCLRIGFPKTLGVLLKHIKGCGRICKKVAIDVYNYGKEFLPFWAKYWA